MGEINGPLIYCVRDGKIHAQISTPDKDKTGFSKIAFEAGWVQTRLPNNSRAYSCPMCHRDAWRNAIDDGCYR